MCITMYDSENVKKIHLNVSSNLRLGLPSGLFPSGFPTKIHYTPKPSPIRATCSAHFVLLDLITRTILGEEYRSLGFPLCTFLHSLTTINRRAESNLQTHQMVYIHTNIFLIFFKQMYFPSPFCYLTTYILIV